MSLTGKQVIVDLDQLPPFTGLLANAKFDVVDTSDNKVYQADLSQLAVPGNVYPMTITSSSGTVENIPALHGRTVLMVFRGGVGIPEVITTGTPDSSQCLWDSSSDDLSCPAGGDWLGGEKLTILYS